MLELIISLAITCLLTSIGAYVAGKKLINRTKDELFDEIFDILRSQEGQQDIFTVGVIFGKGIQQGIGLKGAFKTRGKIFGIPSEIVMPFIKKFLPGAKTISNQKPEDIPGGKFG